MTAPLPARRPHDRPAAPARSAPAWPALLGTPLRRRLAAVYAVGLAAVLACLPAALTTPPAPLDLAAALALLLVGRAVRVPLRLGERRVLVSAYAEGALLLTVVLVSPAWVPLLAGAVTLLGQVPRRVPAWRALMNACALVAPVAAGVGLYVLVSGPGEPASRVAVALFLACPVMSLLNLVAISGVVAAAHGEPWLQLARRDLGTEVTGALVQGAVCAGTVLAWRSGQQAAAVLVPVLGVVVLREVLLRLHAATEFDALARLERATGPVRELDEEPAVAVLLRRAGDLLGVRGAALAISPADAPARTWHWDGTTDDVVRRPRTLRNEEEGAGTVRHVLRDHAGTPVGELELTFPRAPQLSDAERHVLAALVSTVEATVDRCLDVARRTAAARRDSLTGLGNRLDLEHRLAELPVPGAALLLFSLAGFQRVNDTFGYGAGERLLAEVAVRLRAGLRPDDVALRLGNVDFAVLVRCAPRDRPEDLARQCAQRLLARLDAPFTVEGLELPLEAAAGIALTPHHGVTAEELVRKADAALADGAAGGRSVVVHDPGADDDDSVQLLGQLQAGLRLGEIVVHYQPVHDLGTGQVHGAEALVRWQHPTLGLLGPGRFVPLAEQTRLIVPLTFEVLDQAVSQAVRWRQEAQRDVALSVNLSPRCLLLPDLPAQVLQVLALHGLPARLLVLEITETLALTDRPQVDAVLRALRDAGVRLSLDDFGTGFSSMSAMSRTAVDEVKVDRSFVAGAPTNPRDRAVVLATVALAQGLGLPVVAEGIETQEQLALARELGCTLGQGYLLGRPVPAAELLSRLLAPA